MRLHPFAFPLCLATSTAVAIPAVAQPSGPSTTAVAATDRARSLHVEGARLFELGKYDEAYVAFLAAWALKKHPQIAGNLADCEVKIGKYREAAEHFAFMARDPNHEAKPEAKRLAQERLKDVQTRIGTLVISVSLNDAAVLLDGKAIGTSPLEGPIFVEPGAHVVEATLKGYRPARTPLDAPKGSAQNVVLTLEAVPEPPPVPPGGTTEPRRLNVPVIVVGSAVAVAAIAVGGVFLGVAQAKENDAGAQSQQMRGSGVTCASPPAAGACTSLHDLTVGSDTFHNVGVPLLGVGGAIGVGTLVYALLPRSKREQAAPVRVTAAGGPGSAGLWLSGTFR